MSARGVIESVTRPVPVSVVAYPTVAYYPRPIRVYSFHRTFVRPFHRHSHHWH